MVRRINTGDVMSWDCKYGRIDDCAAAVASSGDCAVDPYWRPVVEWALSFFWRRDGACRAHCEFRRRTCLVLSSDHDLKRPRND
jgi:hypothetical protein